MHAVDSVEPQYCHIHCDQFMELQARLFSQSSHAYRYVCCHFSQALTMVVDKHIGWHSCRFGPAWNNPEKCYPGYGTKLM